MTVNPNNEEGVAVQRYLLLDDLHNRNEQFRTQVSTGELRIKTASEAIQLKDVKDQLVVLDGAIVNFHLSTRRDPAMSICAIRARSRTARISLSVRTIRPTTWRGPAPSTTGM